VQQGIDAASATGGGAISNVFQVTLTTTDCEFTGNSSGEGNDDIDSDDSSSAEIK